MTVGRRDILIEKVKASNEIHLRRRFKALTDTERQLLENLELPELQNLLLEDSRPISKDVRFILIIVSSKFIKFNGLFSIHS